jgi:1-acyl-sn-glycerol-3-phosphate acyltransferase
MSSRTQAHDGAQVITLDEHRRPSADGGPRTRCAHHGDDGRACRNYAGRTGYCRVHEPESTTPAPIASFAPGGSAESEDPSPSEVDELIREALAFLRRRITGDYEVDVYGFDRDLTEQVLMPLARPLYRRYWRVRAVGLEHVPAESGALIVANHAGALPFDAIMTKVALFDEHPNHRHLRELAADLALRTPVIGHLARKNGNTLAHGDDATRLLNDGELVGVWPEGFKGIGKLYRDRYKLQRFGRGGFVEVALRTGAPIVPVAIIGAEEIYPMIANAKFLARIFGFPYFPITWQFPAAGAAGSHPAALEVADRLRRADRDGLLRTRGR